MHEDGVEWTVHAYDPDEIWLDRADGKYDIWFVSRDEFVESVDNGEISIVPLATDGGQMTDSDRAICQRDGYDWPAEWHKDKELCEVHAAEEWVAEGGLDEFR